MKSKKPMAPKPQTMPMTPKSSKEKKTARPAKGRNIETPRVPYAPPPLERKKSPKMTGRARA